MYGFNLETGKAMFEKPKAEKAAKVETERVNITSEQFYKLLDLAKADGFDQDADTDQGKKAQNTRTVSGYVRGAVDALIAKRSES